MGSSGSLQERNRLKREKMKKKKKKGFHPCVKFFWQFYFILKGYSLYKLLTYFILTTVEEKIKKEDISDNQLLIGVRKTNLNSKNLLSVVYSQFSICLLF